MTMSREKISTQRKPVSLPLCTQQIRHGMTWEIKKNLSHSFFCFQDSLFLKVILIKMISTIYREMFFIGCSIMLIFEKGACGWDIGMPDSFRCWDVAYNLARPQVWFNFHNLFLHFWILYFCWYCVGKQLGNNLVMCNYCQCVIPVMMNLTEALFLEMSCECLLKEGKAWITAQEPVQAG